MGLTSLAGSVQESQRPREDRFGRLPELLGMALQRVDKIHVALGDANQ